MICKITTLYHNRIIVLASNRYIINTHLTYTYIAQPTYIYIYSRSGLDSCVLYLINQILGVYSEMKKQILVIHPQK